MEFLEKEIDAMNEALPEMRFLCFLEETIPLRSAMWPDVFAAELSASLCC
jgi:hypothetical protein